MLAVNKWDVAPERSSRSGPSSATCATTSSSCPGPRSCSCPRRREGASGALLDAVDRVHAARAAARHDGGAQPPARPGRRAPTPRRPQGRRSPVKILFGSQIGTAPPTFALSINHPVDLHFSYRRYLENRIREAFGFEGTPIRLKVRGRRRKPRS